MTIECFAALEAEIPAVRAERMMDAAQAAVYPHVSKSGARQMWREWTQAVQRSANQAARRSAALFVVDGKPVGISGFRTWIRRALGKGLAAA